MVAGVFGLTLVGCGQRAKSTAQTSRASTTRKVKRSVAVVPTFYVHGFQGSAKSTNTLIAHAEQHAQAKKVLTATVSADGQVQLTGHWGKRVKRPLIQVVFTNNLAQYPQQTAWLTKVLTAVQQAHHFKRYNVVAHSAGCVATVNLLMTAHPASFPRIKQLVTIAGPFDGVVGEDDVANQNQFLASGAPKYQHAAYQLLAPKRHQFPKGVHLLNIVGDLDDGTNSDGLVTHVSARSIKYLLRDQRVHYVERDFHGASAQHSQLHENPRVATTIEKALWSQAH
ncbi:alpha/beta hydrolase [Lactiplantibacillus modestisalitolerans]|uniref:Alpha/beta hydrolase n=1 Tax=Lactiplantibacillus modestisalitolerans TaxID=1457219 RepID=A0ABV5WVV8_9LACO|nr:alpha/beta hydrolase [Lactiplantibacillus modestisalitolerans]